MTATKTLRFFGTLNPTRAGEYRVRIDADFREHYSGLCAECNRPINEDDHCEVTQAVDLTFTKPSTPYREFPQPTAPGEGIHCAEHMSR